ncbi:MAG: GNAT family N-acetyltransferase [Anaerolineales bacterium]
MLPSGYRVRLLSGRLDPLLPAWLDLYETAFPYEERVLISTFWRVLEKTETGAPPDVVLSALVDSQGNLSGMAAYQMLPSLAAGFLWYLAIAPGGRGHGLGSAYYHFILEDVFRSADLLLFEVEIPAHCEEAERRRNAERRIVFYQRNGAALLTGIHYMQSVGSHVPPTPMHLMVHARRPTTAEEAFKIAKTLFGDSLSQTGPLDLIGLENS